MLTGPKLSPLERASCIVSGDQIARHVPSCCITNLLRIDRDWRSALEGALLLVATTGLPEGRELDRVVNRYLDLLGFEMSGLERRCIFDNVTGRNEC